MHWLRTALLVLTALHAGVHAADEPSNSYRTDAAQADRVVELPGARAEDLTFDLFSGCAFAMRALHATGAMKAALGLHSP